MSALQKEFIDWVINYAGGITVPETFKPAIQALAEAHVLATQAYESAGTSEEKGRAENRVLDCDIARSAIAVFLWSEQRRREGKDGGAK
jgi:hypothetical protein